MTKVPGEQVRANKVNEEKRGKGNKTLLENTGSTAVANCKRGRDKEIFVGHRKDSK